MDLLEIFFLLLILLDQGCRCFLIFLNLRPFPEGCRLLAFHNRERVRNKGKRVKREKDPTAIQQKVKTPIMGKGGESSVRSRRTNGQTLERRRVVKSKRGVVHDTLAFGDMLETVSSMGICSYFCALCLPVMHAQRPSSASPIRTCRPFTRLLLPPTPSLGLALPPVRLQVCHHPCHFRRPTIPTLSKNKQNSVLRVCSMGVRRAAEGQKRSCADATALFEFVAKGVRASY